MTLKPHILKQISIKKKVFPAPIYCNVTMWEKTLLMALIWPSVDVEHRFSITLTAKLNIQNADNN